MGMDRAEVAVASERDARMESGWAHATMSVPHDTTGIGEVERETQRLDANGEQLVALITAVFDRFAPALDTTERPEDGARLAPAPVNTSLGRRLSSVNDLLDRQIERLQELHARCEL